MNQFTYKYINMNGRLLLITLLIHDSPLNYLSEINKIIDDEKCNFIIDQYIYIQNSSKRFIFGEYNGLKIRNNDLRYLSAHESEDVLIVANNEVKKLQKYMSKLKIKTPIKIHYSV